MEIPECITQLRTDRGLTRTQFAKLIGVSLPAVIQWEDGDTTPTTKHLQKIALECDVSMNVFDAPKKTKPAKKSKRRAA